MKKILFCLAAFAALVSCTKENPIDNTPAVEYQTITFEAAAPSAEDNDATKTTLVNGNLVHWVKGDAVKIMFVPINGSENQSVWPGKAYDGASGIMTATFDAETSESALFHTDSWNWGVGSEYMGVGIAVYPSSVETYSHRYDDYYNGNAPTVISYNLPSNQTAVENSFQNGVLFSYAEIANVEEFAANQSKLNFKNACALIKVTLPSDAADIVSLTVESSNATLSGKHKVNSYSGLKHYTQYYPIYPLVMASDGGVNNVTLSAPAGETLKAGASYYIVTWPGSHSNGLSFTFTNTLGLTNTKQLAQSVELEASKIDHFNFKNSITFEHVFEVSEDSFDIAGAATGGSFTVTSSRDWTAVSDSEWLTISPASGSASVSAATVTFNAPENTSAERTAKITITAGEDTKVVTVTQAQFMAELSIERYGSWNILPADGDFQYVTIKSNTSWTLSCDKDWLTLEATSGSATAGETVMLTAAENTTTSERTATLYLRDNANTVEKTFTVTQEGGKKTSGYKVVGVVLPEDMQTGKYYVIANYGDPSKYWTVADDEFYSLSLTGGFSTNAFNNEFGLEHIFYVKSITKGAGMTDTNYQHRAQVTLFSMLSNKGMYWVSGPQSYRCNNNWGIIINMGAKWGGETNNSVDMRDSSRPTDYINTPDGSKITCVSGYDGNNTGLRKWLIFEVQ